MNNSESKVMPWFGRTLPNISQRGRRFNLGTALVVAQVTLSMLELACWFARWLTSGASIRALTRTISCWSKSI
jgi:hypothetical protein